MGQGDNCQLESRGLHSRFRPAGDAQWGEAAVLSLMVWHLYTWEAEVGRLNSTICISAIPATAPWNALCPTQEVEAGGSGVKPSHVLTTGLNGPACSLSTAPALVLAQTGWGPGFVASLLPPQASLLLENALRLLVGQNLVTILLLCLYGCWLWREAFLSHLQRETHCKEGSSDFFYLNQRHLYFFNL